MGKYWLSVVLYFSDYRFLLFSLMEMEKKNERYRIGRVGISVTNPQDAERRITKAALAGENGYVCVSNVRTVYMANHDEAYREVMDEAMMCTPDGMPLTWMARLWGLKEVQRTDGPDLFVSMLGSPESGVKHFLLGDTEETLQKMKAEYPDAQIVGTYSPPFKPLEEYDLQGMAEMINQSGAHIVWLSLRSPKQDYLAQRLMPLLKGKVCIGVGAAFRFALGEYKHPNKTVQKLGLTGFFWRKLGLKDLVTYCRYMVFVARMGGGILYARLCKWFKRK